MRYMKNVETGEVRQVPQDDDAQFIALTSERLEDTGRPAWAQTGWQDPDVAAVLTAPVNVVLATIPATAQASDYDQTLGEAPHAGTVSAIAYVAEAAIAGADTNSRTLTVVNKGQDGSGNKVVGTLALTAGVNAVAFDETAYTLSGTAANKKVAVGDILVAVSTHVGTGLADPGGQVRVTIDPAQP